MAGFGGAERVSWRLSPPWTHVPLPLVRPGEEYRPLLFYQETTAQLLAQALNPLDYRKWRNKPVSWRVLKVFKVGGGTLEPGSGFLDSSRTVATQPSPAQ